MGEKGWMERCMYGGRMHEWTDGRKNVETDRLPNVRTNRWSNRLCVLLGQDGYMDGCIFMHALNAFYSLANKHKK